MGSINKPVKSQQTNKGDILMPCFQTIFSYSLKWVKITCLDLIPCKLVRQICNKTMNASIIQIINSDLHVKLNYIKKKSERTNDWDSRKYNRNTFNLQHLQVHHLVMTPNY